MSTCNILQPGSQMEQIAYATVLIKTQDAFGREMNVGTGFLFQKNLGNNIVTPLLITNKHVVLSISQVTNIGILNFRLSDPNNLPSSLFTNIRIENFSSQFVLHPNSEVDLCALNLAPWFNLYAQNNTNLFIRYIPETLIPTDEELKDLDYIEEIFMVGYPRGLSDNVNGYPIFRRGTTASHPYIDFQGKREFLADITNVDCSSGSPVFLRKVNFLDKENNTVIGLGHFYFMGIAYSSELVNTFVANKQNGAIEATNDIQTTMNIAHIIKSSELYKLLNIFSPSVRINESPKNAQ